MNEVMNFLSMGGYAAYIWPTYGVAVVVLGALVVTSLRTARARAAEVAAMEATRPRRHRAGKPSGSGAARGDA